MTFMNFNVNFRSLY